MGEKPRVIKTVEGVDPVQLGVHVLLRYHRAVTGKMDPGVIAAIDKDRVEIREHLTEDQQGKALEAAGLVIRHNYLNDEQSNPEGGR